MLAPVTAMQGEGEEDTRLLKEMATNARDYITSFHWCLPIREAYFADGIGGIIAIFLFEFEGKIGGTDDKLWVVVGDLPSVYMIVEPNDCAKEALETYCQLMECWIDAVRSGDDFDGVYPVDAARTQENADELESRLAFLRKEIIPEASTYPVNTSNRGARNGR